MDQSTPELVVAIFGIWKAVGAYVALDPKLPSDRLEYIVKNSGLKVLLTQKHIKEKILFCLYLEITK